MIREKIKVKDFERISKENEFFIWHFVGHTNQLAIRPFFEPKNSLFPNALDSILSLISVPYFETEIKDSYDFLINLDNAFSKNIYWNGYFQPVMVSFNRRRMVSHTYGPYCFCPEGIIELIGDLNPQFILDVS